MSNSNGIITSPVSIDDVKNVLGESSNDLATLCKSGNINMWAKYKPVPYNGLFSDDWWKGNDGNCGLFADDVASTFENLWTLYEYLYGDGSRRDDGGWNMNAPSGGSSSPYRLGDFRGYDHNARIADYVQVPSSVQSGKSFDCVVSYSSSAYALKFTDVALLKSTYFGVAVYSGTSISTSFTCKKTIGSSDDSYKVTVSGLGVGTYTILPYLSTTAMDDGTKTPTGKLYGFPYALKHTVKIVSKPDNLQLVVTEDGYYDPRYIKVTNDDDSNLATSNISLYVRPGGGSSTLSVGDTDVIRSTDKVIAQSFTLSAHASTSTYDLHNYSTKGDIFRIILTVNNKVRATMSAAWYND